MTKHNNEEFRRIAERELLAGPKEVQGFIDQLPPIKNAAPKAGFGL